MSGSRRHQKIRVAISGLSLAAACAPAADTGPAENLVKPPQAAEPRIVPTGASIEASGFATIVQAPSPLYPDTPPPPENRPTSEAG